MTRASYIFNAELRAGSGEISSPKLYLISSRTESTTTTSDCAQFNDPIEGQQQTTVVIRPQAVSGDLFPGDSLRRSSTNCESTFYRYSGLEYTEITGVEGDYAGGESWTVWLSKTLNQQRFDSITQGLWDGDFASRLNYVLAEHNYGDLQYRGINLSALYPGIAPPVGPEHPLPELISHSSTQNQAPQGPPHIDLPDKRYDIFAYEFIEDATQENKTIAIQWFIDLYYKDEIDASHQTKTIRSLIIEEVENEVDGETETVERIKQGSFQIHFNSGHQITVNAISDSGSLDGGVNVGTVSVSFDADGDGLSDDTTTMTWDAFRGAQSGIVIEL